jgi:hypothetical protein
MYLLSITINIENEHRDEWLNWVNQKLKSILNDKGLVHDFRVLKILKEEPGMGSTFSFQYHLRDMATVNDFEEKYDREIATEMYRFYKEKFVEFRTKLEVVNWEL